VCHVLQRHKCDYELASHGGYIKSRGITEEQFANLGNPAKDHLFTERQREILRFARRFAADPAEIDSLPDHNIEAHLNNRQRIELGMILAVYMGISHFWTMFDIPPDA
jgi:alkylhydroperoxidase family enzyme